jgi:hypothetical protein
MASEACCLLKANLSEDAVALFKSRGLRSFVCVRNVVVLILDISEFALCSDVEAFLSARRFFMQQVSFHGGQCVEATTSEFVVAWGLKDDAGADSEEAREGDVRKAVMVVQAMPKAFQGGKVKGAPVSAAGSVVLFRFPSQLHSISIAQHSNHDTRPATDLKIKSGVSVGSANCFLAAAYSLSPVVTGAAMQKARACMYAVLCSHSLAFAFACFSRMCS